MGEVYKSQNYTARRCLVDDELALRTSWGSINSSKWSLDSSLPFRIRI